MTQMVTCQRCGGGGHLASDCQVDLSNTDNFIPGQLCVYLLAPTHLHCSSTHSFKGGLKKVDLSGNTRKHNNC